MQSKQSLSTFFQSTEPTTLDNCDREQIHLSGAIQNMGALLVMDPVSERIVGYSENAAELLGCNIEQLASASLEDIDADLAAQVRDITDGTHILHEVLDFQLEHTGITHDTVTHVHAGRRLIEFVPNICPTAGSARKNMRHCSKACATILHTDSFDDALQIAVDAVRQITGFARAKIYRFQPDWSGKTIAESNDGSLPSYLGLHFPERDIPKQVRHMMTLVPYRGIGSTSDDTLRVHAIGQENQELDLTWSILRSVSPMHTQYLSNMGVASTFSTSLMHRGSLWGLIACHNTTAGIVPFDSWGLLHEIGTALMIRHEQQRQTDIASMSHRLRLIESRFSSALQQNGRVEQIISLLSPSLQEFLEADGFAFLYGTRIYLAGTTPPEAFIRELVDWADSGDEQSRQYHTSTLQKEWPAASEHQDTACGVLVQSTTLHRVCQLVWFRKPITQKVQWAGCLSDKTPNTATNETSLTPRLSFDRWVQEHAEQSIDWRETELEMAREILRDFLDIITSQLLLNQENEFLRHFAASAAHDLKTPLRGINAALDIMDEEDFDEDVVKQTHAIARKSARRLSDLTSGLMELSMTSDQQHDFEPVDLGTTISDVLEMLSLPIDESGAEITVGKMPIIQANDTLLLRLFLNLIANAIKYRHPERTPEIQVSAAPTADGGMNIFITDNGMGIEPKFADRIFQPLERLHNSDSIEGSGLGLTICQRVVEVHSGTIRLDTDHSEGCRFIVTIPARA